MKELLGTPFQFLHRQLTDKEAPKKTPSNQRTKAQGIFTPSDGFLRPCVKGWQDASTHQQQIAACQFTL
jgi:hypothetical protein